MQIEIKCSGLELTEALRAYVEEKLNRLGKFVHGQDAFLITVELGKTTAHHHKGEVYRAEANMKIDGILLRAEATAEDLYVAIDLLKEEAGRELVNRKTKQESLARRGARKLKSLFKRDKV